MKESTSEPETQFSVVDAGGHGNTGVDVGLSTSNVWKLLFHFISNEAVSWFR